ncbi:MAG: peptidoglycan glycosyltransferase [Acidobacteria bacterium OLB17]|nr:MAG: peptidoglycan glycosyltransferase [Acidobacteria bacterium OLB17]MCZ2391892.1 penicillin-binding protein 2 [Acidobacteriota bacterium]
MKKASKRKKKADPRQVAYARFMFIAAIFGFWFVGIGVRLVHLQVSQSDWLRERAIDQRQDTKKTKLLRGTIYDRDEHPLAMSIRVSTLYADPTEIDDVDRAAKAIAKILKLDQKAVAKDLREGREAKKRYVPIAKKLEDDQVRAVNKELYDPDIKKADEPRYAGFHWVDDQKRTYPYRELAAQVIGFSDAADEGQAGIERSQDELLHGAIIKKLQERDRLGRVYDETVFERERPGDVVLTISTSLQYKTEKALADGVAAANARSGMAVVMDPKTGEILAMANYPTFDPNSIRDAVPANFKNNVVQSAYSPGSVFKLVTYSSGLEKNLFSPSDMIDAGNGTIEVAKHTFRDSHNVGSVTYSEALAHSSNVCAIKTGLRVGKEDFYSTLKKLGFGSKTGIDLPAETAGIVRSPEKWNGDSLASMSIGYEIGVTALQMTSAFATIANNGIRVQPHVIKQIRKDGASPTGPQLAENTRVVSEETARELREMLKQVVLTGTGRRAQLDGYTAAGKTGTAWKFNADTKRVDPTKYISSFIGMAPADSPQVVIAVVMDEPRTGARDGGMVSAPVFKNIAEQILPELGVERDGTPAKNAAVAEIVPETPADPSLLPVSDDESPKPSADPKPKKAAPAVRKEVPEDRTAKTEKKKTDASKKKT